MDESPLSTANSPLGLCVQVQFVEDVYSELTGSSLSSVLELR